MVNEDLHGCRDSKVVGLRGVQIALYTRIGVLPDQCLFLLKRE